MSSGVVSVLPVLTILLVRREGYPELRDDLGRLYASPSARGLGMVGDAPPEPAAPTERAPLITPKRLMWGGILGLGAYVVFTNRKAIAKNIKKVF